MPNFADLCQWAQLMLENAENTIKSNSNLLKRKTPRDDCSTIKRAAAPDVFTVTFRRWRSRLGQAPTLSSPEAVSSVFMLASSSALATSQGSTRALLSSPQ